MMKRRQVLGAIGGAAFGFQVVPRHVLGRGYVPPSEKLNIAGIGIGGQGGGVLRDMAGENIVALCDVDSVKAAGTFKAFPNAEQFRDYRVLLEKRRDIEAVMIATPDHMHAPITIAALRAGKHVYVEKPMAHSIEEARVMARVAQGNRARHPDGQQRTRRRRTPPDPRVSPGRRRSARSARSIAGPTDRASGGSRISTGRPTRRPVPALRSTWDLWIGAAPMRPYQPEVPPPRLARPGSTSAPEPSATWPSITWTRPSTRSTSEPRPPSRRRTSPLKPETYPAWSVLKLRVRRSGESVPALTLTWYDGGQKPPKPRDLPETEVNLGDNGIYFVGDKGTVLCGGWSGPPTIYPETTAPGVQDPAKATLARSIGHRPEWIKACKDGKPERRKSGLRLLRPLHRSPARGQPGAPVAKKDRVGRHRHEISERPRNRCPDPQEIPRRLRVRNLIT